MSTLHPKSENSWYEKFSTFVSLNAKWMMYVSRLLRWETVKLLSVTSETEFWPKLYKLDILSHGWFPVQVRDDHVDSTIDLYHSVK